MSSTRSAIVQVCIAMLVSMLGCGGDETADGRTTTAATGGSTASAGGAGAKGGAGGSGGTTGGGGIGGSGGDCTTASDCPGMNTDCEVRTCDAGVCGTSFTAAGTAVTMQTPGDCKVKQCDGMGAIVGANDDTDVPDDGNECTSDVCDAGVPSNPFEQAGSMCTSGGTLCDGSGSCVECLAPSDCGGMDTECQTITCDAGACGVSNAMQGAPVASQTAGDCQKNQCDGSGGIESVADDADVEDDGNECTDNSCSGGTKVTTPTVLDSPCGLNGALFCDGMGACKGCTAASQCGTPTNACLAAVCNGGTCGTANVPDGSACDDGDACSQTDTCQAGACTSSNPVVCSALDACHDAGVCNPASGVCSNPSKPNGSACSDGNGCTQTDTCQAGTCTGANPVTCSALDQCHDAGVCNPANGVCSNPNKPNGSACSDGNGCTQTDTCQAGACTGANPVTCSALDQCHDAGVCSPATGVCSNPAKPNGSACNDANACTQTDTCQAGTCTGANPVTCSALDPCHDPGTCNPATGVCSNPNKPNGSACSDGNGCTQTDTCQAGTCTGANPVTCSALDPCHDAGVCNPANGVCSNPNKPNGSACSDGNGCTQTDTCQAGACTGANPVTCSALDQCHDAGTCNPANGVCSNPNKANGSACNDANACTQTDTCQAGACTGANPVTCSALDQCHDAGTCNPANGVCSNPNKPNGSVCNDADACTQTDTCQAGACTGANPVTCSALDQCHDAGVCNSATGCSNPNKADGSACNDSDACTQTDTCQAGACTGANPVTCSPLDPCHDAGTCNSATGVCSNPDKANGSACSDGDACTQTDTCQAGTCTGANPVVCPPVECSAGTCNSGTGTCSYTDLADGTSCAAGFCATGICSTTNLVVVRVGDGSAPLSAASTPTFLEKRAADGTLIQTVALPVAPSGLNQPITLSGSATSEGGLSRSANLAYVTLAGYAAAPGVASVPATAAVVNRVVARVDAALNIDTSTRFDAAFSGANVRAATSNDGTSFWVTGSTSSFEYITLGALNGLQVAAAPTNARWTHIFGGQLYGSAMSGTFTNVFTVGAGLPTSAGAVCTSFPGMPTSTASPYSFVLFDRNPAVPGLDTLYVADDRSALMGGGVQKWTFNGATWTLQGTWHTTNGVGVRGLTGLIVGANVVLAATTTDAPPNSRLVGFIDDGVTPMVSATLATAGANTAFRGVALAPQ